MRLPRNVRIIRAQFDVAAFHEPMRRSPSRSASTRSCFMPTAVALHGRYHLERELGAGGMATVYLATDVRHHRKVAVKVLRQELADLYIREEVLSKSV